MSKKNKYIRDKQFHQMLSDCLNDLTRNENGTLYFIEFPDGKWLMEDRISITNKPEFAFPFADRKLAELFMEHYKLDEKLGCKVTEHEFVLVPLVDPQNGGLIDSDQI